VHRNPFLKGHAIVASALKTEPNLSTAIHTRGAGRTGSCTSHTVDVSDAGLSWADTSWFSDPAETEALCRAYLEKLRWPDGVTCPRCDSHQIGRITTRKKFYCRTCRYHFSVTVGTIFHNSHLPVWKWFLTITLMLDSEAGVPANQLVRSLGGSYKTAWFVQHRVRAAIEDDQEEYDERRHDATSSDAASLGAREAAAERLQGDSEPLDRLFDRPIVGPYHQIAVKYMPAYLAEMDWRSRCRRNPHAFRDTVLRLLERDPLAYADLIAKSTAPFSRA
jgi:transposase-like protein